MNPPPPLRAWLNDEQHESTGDEEDFVPEMHDLEVMREAVNGRWRGIDAERMLFPPGTSTSDRARRQGRQMPRAYSDGLGTSRRNNPSLTRAFPSSLILDNEGLNFDRPSGRRRSGDRVAEQQLVGTQLGEGLMIPSSLMPQVAHVLHENEERRAEQRNRPLLTRRALFAWLSRFSAADGEISTGEEGDAEEDEGTDGEQPGPGCELQ
ncbi:hypothetical protein BJ742DRAFT_64049 [Cladochytrium replicatum]|nr:hypothetical protein BJ742DRAFT_64049 [Cladochytrium replicatum]